MLKSEELSNPQSCMNRAREDEMTFVLLGRDAAAPVAIRAWIAERLRMGKNTVYDPQIYEAISIAEQMEAGKRMAENTKEFLDAPVAYRIDELGTLRKLFDALYGDSLIAHKWFERVFGRQLMGRDFAMKVPMADAGLTELTNERDALTARVAELEAELVEEREKLAQMEPRAAFGDQCIQDDCEGAWIAASVAKRFIAEANMWRTKALDVEKHPVVVALQAELATANEVIRQIAERFGITDTRHILGDLAKIEREREASRRNQDDGTVELQAENERLRMAIGQAEGLVLSKCSQIEELQTAVETVVALDFKKTERGSDDFYSGAPGFVTAWLRCDSALKRFMQLRQVEMDNLPPCIDISESALSHEAVAGEVKDRVGEGPLQKLYDDPEWRSEYDSELAAEREALKGAKL